MISRFSVGQTYLGLPFVSGLKNFMTEEDIFGESTEIPKYHTKNSECKFITIYETVDAMSQKIFGAYKSGTDMPCILEDNCFAILHGKERTVKKLR